MYILIYNGHAMTCQERWEGTVVFYQSIHKSKLEGGGSSAARPGCFTPRKDPITIVQEAGWASGLV